MAIGSVQYASLNPSSNGNNTLVAAATGFRIVVLGYVLVSAGTVNAKFTDGAGGAALSGPMNFVVNAGVSVPVATPTSDYVAGWMQTSSGNALVLNLSAGIEVDGHLTYLLVPA